MPRRRMSSAQPQIHRSAVVAPDARLAAGVQIGPMALIGEEVEIGEGTSVGPYCQIIGPTTIGRDNRFFGQASIGTDPQDLKYGGERSALHIGDGNLIREYVTINRGTEGGGGKTVIGNGNLVMTYVHIAHDCYIGNNAILANAATLAGHVAIEDYATVGAHSGVHQFCRVGEHAFIGGYSVITKDVLCFVKTVGSRTKAKNYGINTVGLARRGFSPERIEALKKAYRRLFEKGQTVQEGVERVRRELEITEDIEKLLHYIESSRRGFIR